VRFKPFGATSQSSRPEKEKSRAKPYARLEDDVPKLIGRSYFAGAFVVEGDAAGGFVVPG
jgi:hypothetical protein